MTKTTTLSLITVAILGLNGCGGEKSASTGTSKEVTSISKLSQASQKHSKTDWLEIENLVQDLDNTKGFNTMLLGSMEKNVASLTKVGIDKEMAYAMNSDVMFDDLTQLDIADLDNQVVEECKDNETCKEEAYVSFHSSVEIDKEMAYAMAEDFRKDNNTTLVNDKLLKEFTCEAGEVRTIQHYGLEDVFSTTNGVEPTSQNPSDISQNMIDYNNNVNSGFVTYDETHNNRLFLEDIKNLPAGITKGRFYIGLKSNGSSLQVNDTMSIGDLSGTDRYAKALTGLQGDGWQENLVNTNNPTTAIYSNDFSNIPLNMQTGNSADTLLSLAQSNQRFGAYVQDDTSVDFITVATCSTPDPIKEVTSIVNKFECSEQETLVKILGGEIDNFTPTGDASNPIHPSSDLITRRDANTAYPGVDVTYDYTAYDHHFIDTLALNLSPSQTVTKAEFNIGYKVIGSNLASNDGIYVGDFETNHAGGHLYATLPQGWNKYNLTSNYGYVANVNLFDLNNTLGTGNVKDTMITKNELDVYVQDDTAVDFTQLNLCVHDNCDESAKSYDLNLSQLVNWTVKPADATEHNVFNGTQYEGVWDNTINWFDFENSHSDEVLEIPFCACSNTIVNINNLKADNNATIKLDSAVVVSQQGNDQEAMKRDDMGGNHVDGSVTLPAGTNGGTTHVLRVNVHNFGSEFGVAIDGTLKFKGHLGKCE